MKRGDKTSRQDLEIPIQSTNTIVCLQDLVEKTRAAFPLFSVAHGVLCRKGPFFGVAQPHLPIVEELLIHFSANNISLKLQSKFGSIIEARLVTVKAKKCFQSIVKGLGTMSRRHSKMAMNLTANLTLSNSTNSSEDYVYDYDIDDALYDFDWMELGPSLCVYSITFLAGILGNLLILVSVIRHTHVKSSPVNVFLASLATADLMLIVICLPLKVS